MNKFTVYTQQETEAVAKRFGKLVHVDACFALYGDLGAGKTTFSKYLIQSLNPKIKDVTSPTFNIIQTYPSDISEIWHVDCYRLKSKEEAYELGLQEAIGQFITIIEWPEIIEDLLPDNAVRIYFKFEDGKRIIETNITL